MQNNQQGEKGDNLKCGFEVQLMFWAAALLFSSHQRDVCPGGLTQAGSAAAHILH